MVGRFDKGCAKRLFAKKPIHDPLLDTRHQVLAKVADDGSIDPGCHQAEGIARGHKAVMRRQLLKPGLDHADVK